MSSHRGPERRIASSAPRRPSRRRRTPREEGDHLAEKAAMNPTMPHADLTIPSDVLAGAATAAARYAPSILNTQPWRWRVHPDRLELFAEPSRQLSVTYPDGRLLMLSCGTVLHQACVALAAQGWTARVVR